jgi:hypothetical protein
MLWAKKQKTNHTCALHRGLHILSTFENFDSFVSKYTFPYAALSFSAFNCNPYFLWNS